MLPTASRTYEVDEVKDIRDKAKAAKAYFAQAKNFESERRAVEIRLRAERRAGQMLKTMEKATGNRFASRQSTDSTAAKKLADLGNSSR
jgi:hypothetical protein